MDFLIGLEIHFGTRQPIERLFGILIALDNIIIVLVVGQSIQTQLWGLLVQAYNPLLQHYSLGRLMHRFGGCWLRVCCDIVHVPVKHWVGHLT